MIVFGDPGFAQPAQALLASLRSRLERTHPSSLDHLRTLLIQAGQLEQAVDDALASGAAIDLELAHRVRQATDLAAVAFCHHWFAAASINKSALGSVSPSQDVPSDSLAHLSALVLQLRFPSELHLRVKIPEGFQFYALYPEQHCSSTLRWAESNSTPGRVLVVGIRSIGTTLSAVVRATLLAMGRTSERLTVRPTGHPFERQAALPPLEGGFAHALVVDEGPGLSGSSIASVAQAIEKRGITSVALLPGHGGDPGNSANRSSRDIWERLPRYVTALDELRWHRWSLMESLTRETSRIFANPPGLEPGEPEQPEVHPAWKFIYTHAVQTLYGIVPEDKQTGTFDLVQDCSGGLWRRYAYHLESDWPPVAAQFERMKFRCANHNGDAVLWKFCGLGSWSGSAAGTEALLQRLHRLASLGFTVAPIGSFRGFIAQPWIEGMRLTIADGIDAHILRRIGEYIVAVADPPLTELEAAESISRLQQVLYWNTRETLGESLADRARKLGDMAEPNLTVPAAGDGHLAPHEWILSTAAGNIIKLDCEGHSHDHTIVGRQPIHWDVAGAITEWDIDLSAASPVLKALEKNGITIDRSALPFYLAGYAAFRMGLMSLSLSQISDAAERARVQGAYYFYQNKLARVLNETPERIPVADSIRLPEPTSHQSQAR